MTPSQDLKPCVNCKAAISKTASSCVYCGSKMPHGFVPIGVTVGVLLLLVSGLFIHYDSYLYGISILVIAMFFLVIAWENVKESTLADDEDFDEDDYDKYQYSEPVQRKYWDVIEGVPVKASLLIEYTDANSEQSKRIVDIPYYDGSNYLKGHCHVRDDFRTFRIDRIKSCVDADTGEVIKDIPLYLRRKYETSAEYKLDKTFDKAKDILKVLYYVAKADGQIRANELAIIGYFVRRIAKDESIEDKDVRKKLLWLGVPSMQGFKLAVGRIHKAKPKNLTIVQKFAIKIVETQKTISPGEAEALQYIEKKLS